MPGFLGPWELLLIAAVLVLLFGPSRLPRLGRAIGDTAKEFKDSIAALGQDEPATPSRRPDGEA
jgi:sec-independent protein translocase protein TatA